MEYVLFVENKEVCSFNNIRDLEIYLHEYSFNDNNIRVEERRV